MIDTSLDSTNFYFLFAVLQGLVLAGIILFQKPFRKPNLFLGLLIAFFSSALLHLVLEQSIHLFNARFPIPMDFGLAYGPLAYFHVLSIKQPKRKFTRKDFLHFLPSLLFDGLLFPIAFTYLGMDEEYIYSNLETLQGIAVSLSLIGVVQLAIYTVFIYKEALSTKKVLREYHKIQRWLKIMALSWCGLLGFLAIALPLALIYIQDLDDNSELIYIPLGILFGLFIYGMGYLYLTRYMKLVGTYTEKMLKFKFSPAEIEGMKNELIGALQNRELYKDPSLTLATLASQLNWPINDLSSLINEGMKTNFNDLINQQRVAAFLVLTRDPENQKYSLVGLAEQVGFNSKASFYRVFKKEKGMSPNAFLKQSATE